MSRNKRNKNRQKAPIVNNDSLSPEEQLEQEALASEMQAAQETPEETEGPSEETEQNEETPATEDGDELDVVDNMPTPEETPVEPQEPEVDTATTEENNSPAESSEETPPAPDAEPEQEEAPAQTENPAVAIITANLGDYAKEMARTVQNDLRKILVNQRRLANVLTSAFTMDSEDSRECINLVYAAFRENSTGAFSPRLIYRGVRELAETDAKRAHTLRSIITIILNTLDGATREQTLQHMDFGPLLDEIPDKNVRAGVINYLGLGH